MKNKILCLICAFATVYPTFAQGPLPYDFGTYVVSLTCGGSGFLMRTDTNILLVTARHVLYDENKSLVQTNTDCVSYSGTNFARLSLDLATLDKAGLIKVHQGNRDVAVIVLGPLVENGYRVNPGVSEIISAGRRAMPVLSWSIPVRFVDVVPGNDAYLIGYPIDIGLPGHPQVDPNIPLIRKGVISQKNLAARTLVSDIFVYGGNSGGPVIEVSPTTAFSRLVRVCGIATQFVPARARKIGSANGDYYWNSGYTIVEPMDSFFEIVDFYKL